MLDVKEYIFGVIDICKVVYRNPRQAEYLFRWLALFRFRKNPLAAGLPWITFEAIDFIEEFINTNTKVFEWGSGGSTVFFAKNTKNVISIEHDSNWFEDVQKYLNLNSLSQKTQCLLIQPKNEDEKPKHFSSSAKGCTHHSFKNYCYAIEDYEDESFDVILVDGRARMDCLKLAKTKIKKGGYIVLDNSDYSPYLPHLKMLDAWKRLDFDGIGPFNTYSWQTTIWQRPKTI